MSVWPTTTPAKTGYDAGTDNLAQGQAYLEVLADHVIDIINSRGATSGVAGLDVNGKLPAGTSWVGRPKFMIVPSNGVSTVKPNGWGASKIATGRYRVTWPERSNYTFIVASTATTRFCTIEAEPPNLFTFGQRDIYSWLWSNWTTASDTDFVLLAYNRNDDPPFLPL